MDIYAEFHKAIAVVDREVLLGASPTLEDRVEMARVAVDLVRLSVEQANGFIGYTDTTSDQPNTEEPQP